MLPAAFAPVALLHLDARSDDFLKNQRIWHGRCLGPFLVETCALVEAGVGLEQLDKVMKSYGLPVGPITLADEVRREALRDAIKPLPCDGGYILLMEEWSSMSFIRVL